MTQDTRKRTLHYVLQHLPDGRFAVVEMTARIIRRFDNECEAKILLEHMKNHLQALTDDEPIEDQWSHALARRAAGEDLKAIAKDMGLPYNILRGKWGRRKQLDDGKTGTAPPNGDAPTAADMAANGEGAA